MNAQIDIKTPAGQSLEGFPRTINGFSDDLELKAELLMSEICCDMRMQDDFPNPTIHKNDTITITIL